MRNGSFGKYVKSLREFVLTESTSEFGQMLTPLGTELSMNISSRHLGTWDWGEGKRS